MVERAKRHLLAMPRREFKNGDVHYAGPFQRDGIALTLCGISGVNKDQVRVRAALTCKACDGLARWVWKHRRAHGFGERRPSDGDGE